MKVALVTGAAQRLGILVEVKSAAKRQGTTGRDGSALYLAALSKREN